MRAVVQCPTCGKRGEWFNTPFGPFCSKRCRLVDLGKWLGGEHAISEPLRLDHLAKLEAESDSTEEKVMVQLGTQEIRKETKNGFVREFLSS